MTLHWQQKQAHCGVYSNRMRTQEQTGRHNKHIFIKLWVSLEIDRYFINPVKEIQDPLFMLFCRLVNVKYLTRYIDMFGWELLDIYLALNWTVRLNSLVSFHMSLDWTIDLHAIHHTQATTREMWLPTCVWRQISLAQERRIRLRHSSHTCQFTVPVCV